MKAIPFVASRKDGRSDVEIVMSIVKDAPPDTVIPYSEIIDALSVGLPKPPDRSRARVAINQACKRLLKECKRTIRNVRGVGYRIARSNEHSEIAVLKRVKASRQLRTAVAILENTNLSELTPTQRSLHQSQLMIMGGLAQAIHYTQQKQVEQSAEIDEIRRRLERVERMNKD